MIPKGYEEGESNGLYFYYEDFYYGELSFFILEDDENPITDLMGEELYWDEQLGKHSEGKHEFNDKTVELVSYDKDFIDDFVKLCGDKVILYTVKKVKEKIWEYE